MSWSLVLGMVGAGIGVVSLLVALIVNAKTTARLKLIEGLANQTRDDSHDIRIKSDALIMYTEKTLGRILDHTDQAHQIAAGAQKSTEKIVDILENVVESGVAGVREYYGSEVAEENISIAERAISGSLMSLITGVDPESGLPYRDIFFGGVEPATVTEASDLIAGTLRVARSRSDSDGFGEAGNRAETGADKVHTAQELIDLLDIAKQNGSIPPSKNASFMRARQGLTGHIEDAIAKSIGDWEHTLAEDGYDSPTDPEIDLRRLCGIPLSKDKPSNR